MIVLMAGLPGTGKTTLARELASRTAGRVLSKDEIRSAIFAADEIEYSSRQDDSCLQIMLEVARFLLEQDCSKILFLDGRPFSRRYQIDNVIQVADHLHHSWRILECVCAEEIVRARLGDQSLSATHPARNRNYDLYQEVRSRFESITLPKTVINTSEALELCVKQASSALA